MLLASKKSLHRDPKTHALLTVLVFVLIVAVPWSAQLSLLWFLLQAPKREDMVGQRPATH